jgi:hypothetical protein
MSTTLPYWVTPENEIKLQGASSTTVAWAYGKWNKIMEVDNGGIWISAIVCWGLLSSTLDVTYESIIDISVGMVGNEITKIQVPYSYRYDTSANQPLHITGSFILAEPMYVAPGYHISARAATSGTNIVTFDVSIQYLAEKKQTASINSEKLIDNFKSVRAGGGISVSERAW